MKQTVHTLITLLIVCLLSNTHAQDLVAGGKAAIIDFETDIVDYGTIEQNSNGTRLFILTNKGNAPLIITKVKTRCGCTVPSYPKEPIPPGEQAQLEIHYDTKRLGSFSKTVTVFSNANEAKKVLKITGTVVAPSK